MASPTSMAPYSISDRLPTSGEPLSVQNHASGPAAHHANAQNFCTGSIAIHAGAPATVGSADVNSSRSTACATPAAAYIPPIRRLNWPSRRPTNGPYPFLSYMASAGSLPSSTLHATATHA